jgi:hypothetical protein
MEINRSTAARRAEQRAAAEAVAADQAGVITRRQLSAMGFSSAAVEANIAAARWQALGVHCIAVHTGSFTDMARYWSAVLEAGPRAYVDGGSALVLAGLRNYHVDAIRVTVPRGARVRHRGTGVDIRQTRRWNPDDIIAVGLPRARVPVACVRAALWARSDRQADLVVTMVVQQRLATVEQVAAQLWKVQRDKRRVRLTTLLIDLAGGVGSLGELDVLRGCRERGTPEPDAQVLRRTPEGTFYLDFRWSRWGVVVEVDGIQHGWVENAVSDAIRHNRIALDGDVVLRLPVLGLRLCPDEFFGQIEEALRQAGCDLPGPALAS